MSDEAITRCPVLAPSGFPQDTEGKTSGLGARVKGRSAHWTLIPLNLLPFPQKVLLTWEAPLYGCPKCEKDMVAVLGLSLFPYEFPS